MNTKVKFGLLVSSLVALNACSPKAELSQTVSPAQTPPAPAAAEAPVDVPAGSYTIDPAHTSVLFRVDHLGFSKYTARFNRASAQLQFDPANLAASSVSASIETNSLDTDDPNIAKYDFNAELTGEKWLDAAQYPEITFRSTRVEATGARTLRIHGDLTLHGATRPVTLDARFNGGYAGHPMDPNARIGFSARAVLKRSEFGVAAGIPAPGSMMGVSDEVEVIIETEFSGPPLASAAEKQSAH